LNKTYLQDGQEIAPAATPWRTDFMSKECEKNRETAENALLKDHVWNINCGIPLNACGVKIKDDHRGMGRAVRG
jgi:hypothetical protein